MCTWLFQRNTDIADEHVDDWRDARGSSWRISLIPLKKPQRNTRCAAALYGQEYMSIDSSSTVMGSCGGCHDLRSVHGQPRTSSAAGVGIAAGPLSGTATIDNNLNLNLSAQAGQNGLVVVLSSSQPTISGPKITVNSGTRTVQTSGSSTDTQSTRVDKTRGG
jgi:hypothetical protein